jgi:hypothetical protein
MYGKAEHADPAKGAYANIKQIRIKSSQELSLAFFLCDPDFCRTGKSLSLNNAHSDPTTGENLIEMGKLCNFQYLDLCDMSGLKRTILCRQEFTL